MLKKILLTLILIALTASCADSSHPQTESSSRAESPREDWWREAIFYEIFVRSFYDSNQDGIGDFNGIAKKLDYLQDLGITALWLMPIHPSPSYHGYDVTDYYAVNPQYGSMDDFKNLLAEAHRREMRIIIDLVLNHTSSEHEWFRSANSDPHSPYRNYYVWSEESQGAGWHAGQPGYYFGLFWEGMPDLNYNNPAVTADMLAVTDYWLNEVGVDGFRVDAAKHLIEDGNKTENTPATHEWFKGFYAAYKTQNPQAYTVGEIFGAGSSVVKSYTGDQLDHVFNFEMSSGFVNSANGGAASGINSAIKFALMDIPDFNYATFLTNHDQNRAMSVFYGNEDKAKIAAFLMLTSPGTPYIYYGEEIGMQGQKLDEDIRLPMQWSNADDAGFSTSAPWRAVGSDYATVNVAAQQQDPASLWNHYKTLIHLRSGRAALRGGNITLLETGSAAVFAAIRSSGDEHLLILANLGKEAISDYQLILEDNILPNGRIIPALLFGQGQAQNIKVVKGKFSGYIPFAELPPYGMYLLELK